jgi:intergrase/recombinase
MNLSELLNSINYSKKDILTDPQQEKEYVPFVINRCLSYFPDTILHANEMNRLNFLDRKVQYDYYLRSIRTRKRFSKWLKREEDKNIELIKQYYGFSDKRAREALSVLSDADIKNIKKEMDIGGSRK